MTSLPHDLGLTVAVALDAPDGFFAAQRRRERLLGGAVWGAVGLSVIAAAVTWTMPVRQHRRGVQKSNFVASVSHELRAPLASVRVLADNLEQDRVTDPGRRATTLRLIGRECRRLGALVDNVLDLWRIERRRMQIEPFHRLGNGLRREHSGIGIGLSIVRHLVEAHGGSVRVESAMPTGARFLIRMPVGLPVASGGDETAATENRASRPASWWSRTSSPCATRWRICWRRKGTG